MDIYTLVSRCLRRWYVFFPVILVAVLLANGLSQRVQPQFSAAGTIIILPQREPAIPGGGTAPAELNPFLIASGGERLATAALQARLSSADVRRRVSASYQIEAAPTQPLLSVVATAGSPDGARSGVEAVRNAANDYLRDLQTQAGAPEDRLLQAVSVTDLTAGPATYPNRARLVVSALAAGGILAVLAVLLLDVLALATRRRRRKGEGTATLEPAPSADRALETASTG